MSTIAQILGQTLFAIVGGIGGVGRADFGHADRRPDADMRMDAPLNRRARSRN